MRMAEKKQTAVGRQVIPGDLLVVAGSIGQTGVRRLLSEKKEWFMPRFSKAYLEGILQEKEKFFSDRDEALEEVLEMFEVSGWQEAGEGGILKAIWDLSGEHEVGVSFELRRIPVKQHVIEICEHCKANPYALWCGQCLLLTVRKGWQLVQRLKELGMEAEVIGVVQEGIARRIFHGGEGAGYLERPKEDELYRLLRQTPGLF